MHLKAPAKFSCAQRQTEMTHLTSKNDVGDNNTIRLTKDKTTEYTVYKYIQVIE